MLAIPRCSTADAPIVLSHAGTSPCSPDVCLRLAALDSSRPCRNCRDFPTAAGSGADPGGRRSQPLHDPTCARTARPGPRAAQARQLLLDPAVAREFERLRGEAEGAGREARGGGGGGGAAPPRPPTKARPRAPGVRRAACARSCRPRTSARSPRSAGCSWLSAARCRRGRSVSAAPGRRLSSHSYRPLVPPPVLSLVILFKDGHLPSILSHLVYTP